MSHFVDSHVLCLSVSLFSVFFCVCVCLSLQLALELRIVTCALKINRRLDNVKKLNVLKLGACAEYDIYLHWLFETFLLRMWI